MLTRKLSDQEKKSILSISCATQIETINARKNFINKIISDWVYEDGGSKNCWLALYTQY
jgi:hypothetical protein